MVGFRENETDNLISDKTLNTLKSQWLFVCYNEDNKIKYVRVELDKDILKDLCGKKGGQLFMVWHGKWRTDIFSLDYAKVIANINSDR